MLLLNFNFYRTNNSCVKHGPDCLLSRRHVTNTSTKTGGLEHDVFACGREWAQHVILCYRSEKGAIRCLRSLGTINLQKRHFPRRLIVTRVSRDSSANLAGGDSK